jgi:hypothetical protein
MIDAVEDGAADVIGLARPIAVEARLPPPHPRRHHQGQPRPRRKSATQRTSMTCSVAPGIRNKSPASAAESPRCRTEHPFVGLAIMLATTLRDRMIVRIPTLAGRRS